MRPLTSNRPALVNCSHTASGPATALVVPIRTTAKHSNPIALNIQTASFFLTTIMNRMRKSLHKTGIFGLAFLIANLFLGGIAFSQPVVVTNPASPWTVPANVTSIKVEVWGGGGGGGATNGGGGGGGAYNMATFSVTPGHTFIITVGTGGSSATAGGTTTVAGVDGTVSANGGGAGVSGYFDFDNFLWVYGGGGSAGTGLWNGGTGGTSTGNGAGGGGGAGNNGNGGDGDNAVTGSGGAGNPNSAPYIGGIGGAFRTSNGTGHNGFAPGGGGGGGKSGFTAYNGGSGGAGQVVITYTVCPTITASAAKNDVKCFATSTGEIIVSGSGGTSPYTFSINNGTTYQPSNTFSNLPVGTYQIRVRDANGCVSKSVQ